MRTRALPLVATMWLMTGVSLASAVSKASGSGHPSADPGNVYLLLTMWMSLFAATAFLRFAVVPCEVETSRRISGAEAAHRRAEGLQESMWYLLGTAPLIALMAFALTGWAVGAAALWVGSLLGMLLLAPDPQALERLAAGQR